MKRLTYIFTIVAALACSCSQYEETAGSMGDGVRIEFLIPQVYDNISGSVMTKAVDTLDPLRHINDDDPSKPHYARLTTLPVGSTLWLTYSKKNEETGEYSDPELQAYKIVDNGGYHSMFACTFHQEEHPDGLTYNVIDEQTTGKPLILDDGSYKFKLISPALPITLDPEKGWRLPVDNGMYFCATDGRYHETVAKDVVVDSKSLNNNGKNVLYVKLNPIINQTARWRFRIFKGDNVESLEMMAAGIEVSGLQNPYDTEGQERVGFYWASDDIADTLKMKMGDKLQWVKLPAADIWKAQEISPSGLQAEALCGDVGFLPTNALSTTVVILFNFLINGIPTQYETTVNQMIFEHGHSYNIGVEVDQKDGIRVFNWLNQSWTGDLELHGITTNTTEQ